MSGTLYSSLLHTLQSQGIPYAVLRDHPESPSIRDFDLLIDRHRYDDFMTSARQHGFRLLKSGRLNPGKKVLLCWEENNAYLIDLHERLIYRGYEYLEAQRVLVRRRNVAGYEHLSTEDELLTLLWHNILGKEQIQAKHRDRLAALLATPLDDEYLQDHLRRFGLDGLFVEIRRNFSALREEPELVRQIKQRALRRLRFKPWANAIRQIHLGCLEVLEGRLGSRRGALIAFIGPDGCGKSSITDAVRAEFRRATIATDVVYLGPWGQNHLPLFHLVRVLHLKPFYQEEKNKRDFNKRLAVEPGRWQRLRLFMRGLFFYIFLALEMWFRYWVMVLPRLRRGRIVLADRYIYDLLVGYKNRPLRHFQRLRAWLCRLYPRPDFTVLLDARPEVIFARKPQFKVEQLEYIRHAYQELRKMFELYELDTSISVEKTLADFRRDIPPRLWQRWKT
ncbi:MAG: dTMP kinase [bacterium]